MAWSSDPTKEVTGREAVDSWYSEIQQHQLGCEPRSLANRRRAGRPADVPTSPAGSWPHTPLPRAQLMPGACPCVRRCLFVRGSGSFGHTHHDEGVPYLGNLGKTQCIKLNCRCS
ncbi:uncharacterized protein LOC144114110 [Amblyomma americanum]